MPPQIHFYTTRNDLLPLLEDLERRKEIQYVRFGWSDGLQPETYQSAQEIPNLGIADHESGGGCTKYLICKKGAVLIHSNYVIGRNGKGRFVFDQLVNPETVGFGAGGLWRNDILLSGNIGSASSSPFSLEILKLARAVFRKHCNKIQAYYVGREAEKMLDEGKRLAIAEQTPPLFNLRRKVN